MTLVIRSATPSDAPAIAEIYAPIVRESHLSAEFEPPDAQEMASRIVAPTTFDWLVAEMEGRTAGYAYATQFRKRPAYQWCAEVSVYIHADFRQMGVGEALYRELHGRLLESGFRHSIAVIALPNGPSVAFHEKFGFVPVGVFPRICYKLDRWYDIGWWRYPLSSDPGPPPIRSPRQDWKDG